MHDEILARFKLLMEDSGLDVQKIDNDGIIYIQQGDKLLKIDLENVRKSCKQDGTFEHLENLIHSIHNYFSEDAIPNWNECKDYVFLSLFPSNFGFQDFIVERVTNDFYKNYVYYANEEYVWIDSQQLDLWEIDEQTMKEQVDKNMSALLDRSNIEVLELNSGAKLAVFHSEIEGLKSSLLFAQNLKDKISPLLGFPIYCVLPVRDFCYMFSEKDKDELIRVLGQTVLNEYRESGYSITTEIVEISQKGIQAIGKYQT